MFFDGPSGYKPSLTMTEVKQMANEISRAYTENSVAPTDSLTKVAHERGLTPHQIAVVAGETNKTIHIEKYASAEDKYHAADFPLADAKAVIDRLQIAGEEKTASAHAPIPDPQLPEFDFNAAFGVEPEEMDKTASEKAKLNSDLSKLAHLKNLQDNRLGECILEKQAAEAKYVKVAKQFIMQSTSPRERLEKIGIALHAAKCAELEDTARPILAKLAYAIGQTGLLTLEQQKKTVDYLMEKKADETAPDELISEWIKARVVNGDHPLIVTLKTYKDCAERERELESRCNIVDDKIRIYGQKIRAL